jgi:uncharacterized protein with von Willebrand factor type A (vWA) domain
MANDSDVDEFMLTTVDNPFDPFTMFDEWYAYDTQMGYHTMSFLDRISNLSSDLSDRDQARAFQEAIDEVVEENVSGMWKKVSKDSVEPFMSST